MDDLKKFENEIPKVVSEMGSIGQNHFVRSFANQGFTDDNLEKWPDRKRDDRLERGKPKRAILVKSGRLRRSIRKVVSRFSALLVTDVPYATIHNEGGTGRAFGKHSFKMPKRQFVGYSKTMSDKIQKMIDRHVRRVFNE